MAIVLMKVQGGDQKRRASSVSFIQLDSPGFAAKALHDKLAIYLHILSQFDSNNCERKGPIAR